MLLQLLSMDRSLLHPAQLLCHHPSQLSLRLQLVQLRLLLLHLPR